MPTKVTTQRLDLCDYYGSKVHCSKCTSQHRKARTDQWAALDPSMRKI